MRRTIFLMVVFVSCFLSDAFSMEIKGKEVDVTLGQTYVSRYIWRGLDLYRNNDGAYQPSIDVALKKLFLKTDLSFNVWGAFLTQGGHELARELDYSVKASHDYDAFNISTGYVYFDYPQANNFSDINEFWSSFSLFRIPVLPVAVSFNLFSAYEFPASHGGPERGWYYSWGFGTEVPLPACLLTQEKQKVSFGITNWGNDGVGGLKPSALYSTELALTTSYHFGSFTVTPGFHYAINYVESINDENEIWGGLDISYSF